MKATCELIVEAADRLFYHQGYERTSFANIADEVHISRGNFYHHFKSKDALLQAVIRLRLNETQRMLDDWECEWALPVDRILAFVEVLHANREPHTRYGCPIGTLCTELAKGDHLLKGEANALFFLFRTWLSREFVALGYETEAEVLAMRLISRTQGISSLSNIFGDKTFARREIQTLCEWVRELAEPSCSLN